MAANQGTEYVSSKGTKFNDRLGWAKGGNQKYPEQYEDYYLRPHDMVTLNDNKIQQLIRATVHKGKPLSDSEVKGIVGTVNFDNKLGYYHTILDDNYSIFGFNANGAKAETVQAIKQMTPEQMEEYNSLQTQEEKDKYIASINTESTKQEIQEDEEAYREAAEDYYWRQLYDLEGNTLGADMYNRLTQAEQNAAMSNMQLAEAQYQQAAMDQASVVKSITDQVKAERMAKLKAGMNEAQIANQDMQIMLNNMNTLNQQVNTLNQNRLAAQQQYNLAQDTAYQQYLNSAAGMAQAGAAYSAAGAGDATRQSLLNMYYTDKYGNTYKKSNQNVTGQTTNSGGTK